MSADSFIDPAHQNGLIRATSPDKSVWLYGKLPGDMPLLDGASDKQRRIAASQLMGLFDQLAALVPVGAVRRRSLYQSLYRRIHVLATAMPRPYQAPPSMRASELGRFLNQNYKQYMVQNQSVYVGVKLNPSTAPVDTAVQGKNFIANGVAKAKDWLGTELDSWANSLANGSRSFQEYMKDAETIATIMRASGIIPFIDMSYREVTTEVNNMRSWWVSRALTNRIPILPENDHMHTFPDIATAKHAKHLLKQHVNCHDWNIPQEIPVTMLALQSTEFSENSISNPANEWIARLLAVRAAGGVNAIGVSVRARVEPANVTRSEITRNARAIDETIAKREKKNYAPSGELEEISQQLNYKRSIYKNKDMPPSLTNVACTVAVAGDHDMAATAITELTDMTFAGTSTAGDQLMLFQSMQPCSPYEYTPYNLDWSATMLAGSGLSSFAQAGDSTGVLLGFTELNRQPVYLSPTLAQDEDRKPFTIVVGATGSGKTMILIPLGIQFSKIRTRAGIMTPVRFINFKQGADFTNAVRSRGGKVYNMDSDMADGIFDPLRVVDKVDAKDIAVQMLTEIIGADRSIPSAENVLSQMLDYGIRQGATTTGTAIECAYQNYKDGNSGELPENTDKVHDLIIGYAKATELFRLIFGMSEDAPALNMEEGLSLIQSGDRDLAPDQNKKSKDSTMIQRIKQWVMRLTILGVGNTVRGKDGVVIIDEAWAALGSGASSIINQWGRLAREQRMNFVFGSQRAQEFIEAGLEGAVQRVLVLSMDDRDETHGNVSQAREALRLADIDDTDNSIISRMPLQNVKGKTGQPEWRSLKALREEGTRRVLRGSICYFKDASNPPVAVEITVPKSILNDISTSAIDKDLRAKQSANKQTVNASEKG